MSRGFACVGLDNPKCNKNVGAALRAAHVYGCALVVLSGQRYSRRIATDTTKAWKHMPLIEAGNVFDAIPHECVPVAVDLVDGAQPLPFYAHPERAFYIFGAEDETLSPETVARCKHRIMVPTAYCMNLAATINVVLYDRLAKGMKPEVRTDHEQITQAA